MASAVVDVPVGVKVIAVWYFVGAALAFLFVPFLLVMADVVNVSSSALVSSPVPFALAVDDSSLSKCGPGMKCGDVLDDPVYELVDEQAVDDSSSVDDFTDEDFAAFFDSGGDLPAGYSDSLSSLGGSPDIGSILLSEMLSGAFGMLPSPILFVILSVVLLGVGLLSFFVGLGLWRGAGWARVTAIVLALVCLLFQLPSLYLKFFWSGGFFIVLYLLVAGYLLFDKSVGEAFSS